MKLIDQSGPKFKTHKFETKSSFSKTVIVCIKTCSNCGYCIYHPVNYSNKLCESIFSAFGLQLNQNFYGQKCDFEYFSDVNFSCDEYIIKNIIE